MTKTDELTDYEGNVLQPGDTVVKAEKVGSAARLSIREVDRIVDGKLYLKREAHPWQTPNTSPNHVPCLPTKVLIIRRKH